VAVLEGRVVGHYGGWPLRAFVGGEERTIVSVGDVATEPAVRHLGGRRTVFRSMAEELFSRLRADSIPFVFGFPNRRALEAGARLLGYRAEFPVREVALSIARPFRERGVASDSVGPSFDALWEGVRRNLRSGLVRDRRRVNWRYHARPDRYYRFVTLPGSAEEDRAWGALSVVGERALVVDFLVARESETDALLEAIRAEAHDMGARRLVFWETPGGPLARFSREGRSDDPSAEVSQAGFSFATVPFDENGTAGFVREAAVFAGIYDDR
jgi:GNAT acetyltransferase-like protein